MPAGFARAMHGEGGHNLGLSERGARRARYQLGAFDKNILCGVCDRKLGQLDEYALGICNRELPRAALGSIGTIADVDCDRMASFAVSVVWRASVSAHPSFATIDLGPLSDRARSAAFDHRADQFPVIIYRLVSPRYDVRQFYVEPARRRIEGVNAYSFHLGGFQWFVFADSRSLPNMLRPLTINGRGDLVSLAIPLERTTEFQGMLEIADRQRRRQ
jgi:hypothetical protein